MNYSALFAQIQQPDFGLAFPQNEVATVRINIHPDSLAVLLELGQEGSEHEFPVTFRFESAGLTQTIQNIGFRLRGNTSLNAAKKSFKVSFNTFIEGARWQGLEKMNLNGSHNDPTRIRTKLCWDMLRKAQLPAARTSMVQLYINEQNMGVYTHVEHIDETFVERVFENPYPGNLYKCLYPADLDYISSNPADYRFELNGRRAYDLKTNAYADNYSDLAEFIEILNQSPLEDLPCRLEPIFQVDRYLKQAAFDVLSGNWDGYIFNKNNYYLYKNRKTGQFEFIQYDLDNTLGIDWVNQDWSQQSVYNWASSSQQRPLYKRLLQVPAYRNRFSYYLNELMQEVFHPDSLRSKIDSLQNRIAPFVAEDPFHSLDYGFTFTDFYQGDSVAWGNQVDFGILPFVEARRISAAAELEAFTEPGVRIITTQSEHDFPLSDTLRVVAFGAGNVDSLLFEYGFEGNTYNNVRSAFDNGVFPDLLANDGQFTLRFEESWTADKLYFRWRIPGEAETYPCSGDFIHISQAQAGLVINEAMSANNGVILDGENLPSDWIELWNGGFSGVNLSGFYLTDNPENRLKFELAPDFLSPGQFRLYWANGMELLDRINCNFSMNDDGEELRLYRLEEGKPRLYDRVNLPSLQSGFSLGRAQDGAQNWIVFEAPTPGQSNQTTGMASNQMRLVTAFPNPADKAVHFFEKFDHVTLLDINGRVVIEDDNCDFLDTALISNGIYILRVGLSSIQLIVQHP